VGRSVDFTGASPSSSLPAGVYSGPGGSRRRQYRHADGGAAPDPKSMHLPRFEPIALDHSIGWKYHAQILPTDGVIHVTLEVVRVKRSDQIAYGEGQSSLWIDRRRICGAESLALWVLEP